MNLKKTFDLYSLEFENPSQNP